MRTTLVRDLDTPAERAAALDAQVSRSLLRAGVEPCSALGRARRREALVAAGFSPTLAKETVT